MGSALIKATQTDFFREAETSKKGQLLVIPYSHFCDLAIWSLEVSKINFEKHGFAPGQHILPVLSVRRGGETKYISSSSHVEPVVKDPVEKSAGSPKDVEKRGGDGSTAVPIMVLPDGKVLTDSWSILKESGLPAIDGDMFPTYDEELGPLTRQLAYHFLLKPENSSIWNALCTDGYSWTWRTTWSLGFGGQVSRCIAQRHPHTANHPTRPIPAHPPSDPARPFLPRAPTCARHPPSPGSASHPPPGPTRPAPARPAGR